MAADPKKVIAHFAAKRALHDAVAAKEAEEDAALAPIREKHAPLIEAARAKVTEALLALEPSP